METQSVGSQRKGGGNDTSRELGRNNEMHWLPLGTQDKLALGETLLWGRPHWRMVACLTVPPVKEEKGIYNGDNLCLATFEMEASELLNTNTQSDKNSQMPIIKSIGLKRLKKIIS